MSDHRMFPELQRALERTGHWPQDVLHQNPQITEFLFSQGLDSERIDELLTSVVTDNWDLTSAYICCTGTAPLPDDRPYFLADFLGEHHPEWLDRQSILQLGKILLRANLI